ncbi:hypothetical protein KC336_g21949, partial [Hortaea werneckii]
PEYPPRGSSMQEHTPPVQPQQQQQHPSAASLRSPPPQQSSTSRAELIDTGNEADHQDLLDLETEFSKRYPSLNGIEMVEREISGAPRSSGAGAAGGARREMTVRDV